MSKDIEEIEQETTKKPRKKNENQILREGKDVVFECPGETDLAGKVLSTNKKFYFIQFSDKLLPVHKDRVPSLEWRDHTYTLRAPKKTVQGVKRAPLTDEQEDAIEREKAVLKKAAQDLWKKMAKHDIDRVEVEVGVYDDGDGVARKVFATITVPPWEWRRT